MRPAAHGGRLATHSSRSELPPSTRTLLRRCASDTTGITNRCRRRTARARARPGRRCSARRLGRRPRRSRPHCGHRVHWIHCMSPPPGPVPLDCVSGGPSARTLIRRAQGRWVTMFARRRTTASSEEHQGEQVVQAAGWCPGRPGQGRRGAPGAAGQGAPLAAHPDRRGVGGGAAHRRDRRVHRLQRRLEPPDPRRREDLHRSPATTPPTR